MLLGSRTQQLISSMELGGRVPFQPEPSVAEAAPDERNRLAERQGELYLPFSCVLFIYFVFRNVIGTKK